VIRVVVMMYIRFPLSLRNVEDLLFERGIGLCHDTALVWWHRFGHFDDKVDRCSNALRVTPAGIGFEIENNALLAAIEEDIGGLVPVRSVGALLADNFRAKVREDHTGQQRKLRKQAGRHCQGNCTGWR
jgi:transposase-like protein